MEKGRDVRQRVEDAIAQALHQIPSLDQVVYLD